MSAASRVGSPEPIAALNRVKIQEHAREWPARESLVDIRAYCPGVFCNEGICPYLRRTVADRLNHAQNSLPPGYRLKVGTALRTLAMQQRGWNGYYKRMREEHPDWPLSALRRATNKYHAPYDQKAPPGHCTGGAVDVHLLDPDDNALDMIAPTEGWQAVDTFSDKLSPEAKANRMLMVEAMLGAGFSNCRDEYWHYSWGDSAWAVRVGETECPYGWTYAPPLLETYDAAANAQEQSLEATRDRDGKPLNASGTCKWPDAAEHFSIRLLWTNNIPVTLRVQYDQTQTRFASTIPFYTTPFYIGDGKETWEPIGDVQRDADTYVLRVTPAFDRAVITTLLPPPPSAPETNR